MDRSALSADSHLKNPISLLFVFLSIFTTIFTHCLILPKRHLETWKYNKHKKVPWRNLEPDGPILRPISLFSTHFVKEMVLPKNHICCLKVRIFGSPGPQGLPGWPEPCELIEVVPLSSGMQKFPKNVNLTMCFWRSHHRWLLFTTTYAPRQIRHSQRPTMGAITYRQDPYSSKLFGE